MLTENCHQRCDTKVPLHPVTSHVTAQVMVTPSRVSTWGFPLHPGWAAIKARLNSHHFVNPTPEAASSPLLPPQPEGPEPGQLHASAFWFMENHVQCPNIAQILE